MKMESFLALFDTGEPKSKRRESWGKNDCDIRGNDEDNEESLPPEPEQGNIEYKLKLVNPSSQRFEHLVTQMKWRLREGHGEAIYQIGVEDNGRLAGLSRDEMKASLKTLRDMASRLGATTRVLRERIANAKSKKKIQDDNPTERRVAEVMVTKLRKGDRDDQDSVIDLRLAVVGSQDAGKSTLLGVLTQGELDNGRGRARLNMLRHLHEIRTGRTSSISHEIIGFDTEGHVLNYAEMTTAEEICEHASKVVTFIDLAGHRKYLRTTLLGLMGYSPHHVMLVVALPLNEVAQEHMALCLALHLPFFIVVTKTDLGLCDHRQTLMQLEIAVRAQGCHKELVLCSNNNDLPQDYESSVIPVFTVSSVTGTGLEELTNFIRDLSPSESSNDDAEPGTCLFQIDETFRVAGLSEPVLGGLLVKGAIAPGARLLVGPLPDGEFSPVKVVSLHRNKAPCCVVRASQSASLTLAPSTNREGLPHFRPGMVLVSIGDRPHATVFFQATVLVVYHATAIYPGFQATVHVGNVRQTCVIEGIMDIKEDGLQTNETASVLFRFVSHPEYLHVGMRLLFREGKAKGIGKITQVFPLIGSESSPQ
ncbi:GTP-binding protein 2 isoform X1 [Diachasmimorpha longicaudata]|uniref:GTP-binding protein 2 isoform X1 n=2 Tax=Diachasmimorpha longicaudata TaxID=58733 RepID=UPI0030B8FB46